MLALYDISLLTTVFYEFEVGEIILDRIGVQGSGLCKETIGLLPMDTKASNKANILNSGRHHTYSKKKELVAKDQNSAAAMKRPLSISMVWHVSLMAS